MLNLICSLKQDSRNTYQFLCISSVLLKKTEIPTLQYYVESVQQDHTQYIDSVLRLKMCMHTSKPSEITSTLFAFSFMHLDFLDICHCAQWDFSQKNWTGKWDFAEMRDEQWQSYLPSPLFHSVSIRKDLRGTDSVTRQKTLSECCGPR